jgi:SAM-dependent methyltransferase
LQDRYDSIARYYDLEHSDARSDIDFYLRLLDPGPVLEIGVGTGRIALPLVEAGFEVWGVDASRAMLEHAASRLSGLDGIHLHLSELPQLRLERKFPTAIVPLNVLWHLPDYGAQLESLRAIRGHLEHEGLLVVDTSNPHTLADRGSNGEMRMRFSRMQGSRRVTCVSAAWDDGVSQTIRLELIYDAVDPGGSIARSHAALALRYVFRDQLEEMLGHAGFGVRHIYGSYDLDPYETDCPGLIAVSVTD